jgi:hypothetical protein
MRPDGEFNVDLHQNLVSIANGVLRSAAGHSHGPGKFLRLIAWRISDEYDCAANNE